MPVRAQSYLIISNCSLPGSSVPGSFQARILEWLPFPAPRDLPNPGIEPVSLVVVAGSLEFALTFIPKRPSHKTRTELP